NHVIVRNDWYVGVGLDPLDQSLSSIDVDGNDNERLNAAREHRFDLSVLLGGVFFRSLDNVLHPEFVGALLEIGAVMSPTKVLEAWEAEPNENFRFREGTPHRQPQCRARRTKCGGPPNELTSRDFSGGQVGYQSF